MGESHAECETARMKDNAWLTARMMHRSKPTSDDSSIGDAAVSTNKDLSEETPVIEQHTSTSQMTQPIPTWSGFNSLISSDETPLKNPTFADISCS